jgi:hypothetical protein
VDAHLSAEELDQELIDVSERLAKSHEEMAQIKIQHAWLYHQGYRGSQESSVAGRDRDGEYAAMSIHEDELALEGNIAAQSVLRDLIVELRRGR